jgi:hypothetical protein
MCTDSNPLICSSPGTIEDVIFRRVTLNNTAFAVTVKSLASYVGTVRNILWEDIQAHNVRIAGVFISFFSQHPTVDTQALPSPGHDAGDDVIRPMPYGIYDTPSVASRVRRRGLNSTSATTTTTTTTSRVPPQHLHTGMMNLNNITIRNVQIWAVPSAQQTRPLGNSDTSVRVAVPVGEIKCGNESHACTGIHLVNVTGHGTAGWKCQHASGDATNCVPKPCLAPPGTTASTD